MTKDRCHKTTGSPSINEFDLIGRLFAPLSRAEPGAWSLTDDAAALTPKAGCDLVLTKDAITEGIHFFSDDPPEAVAARLMRVNLSDLAAKGAMPRAYLLAMVLRRGIGWPWMEAFATALGREQARFGGTLVGGDTVVTTGPLTFSLTAIGEVATGAMIRRTGARSGDLVCISGTLGDAALYVALRLGGRPACDYLSFEERFRYPQPRLRLGWQLCAGAGRASVDVSDGLVADLGHICEASGLGAVIDRKALPLSAAALTRLALEPALWEVVLTGGDDYEIVFAVDPMFDVNQLATETATKVTVIGRFVDGAGVTVRDESGAIFPLSRAGWTHKV